jgi:hypothetical protein
VIRGLGGWEGKVQVKGVRGLRASRWPERLGAASGKGKGKGKGKGVCVVPGVAFGHGHGHGHDGAEVVDVWLADPLHFEFDAVAAGLCHQLHREDAAFGVGGEEGAAVGQLDLLVQRVALDVLGG